MPHGKFQRSPAEGEWVRRHFAMEQAAKSALGGLFWFAYVMLFGRPDFPALIALAGFLVPCALGLLALSGVSLAILETASFVWFAALVGYIVVATGGVRSPLLLWFVVLPAEAVLVDGRRWAFPAAVAGLAVAGIGLLEALHEVPSSRFPQPFWPAYAASALAAIVQSALVGLAAQLRRPSTDFAIGAGAETYRTLAEEVTDLITRHAPDGEVLYASSAARRLLDLDPSSLEKRPLSTLVHSDDLHPALETIRKAAVSGLETAAELRFRKGDGSFVVMEMRCRPAARADVNLNDVIAVTRDITERKVREEALIAARESADEASCAKSRFLAHMSHELRTPLNAIIGFSEVMTHEMFGVLGHPRYLEYSRLIHESGSHLLDLINGVLDMSKIEAGKFDLDEAVFDFAATAEQALRLVALPAERKDLALKTSIAPGARTIFADQRAVKQILLNLLSNAVKFTMRGGEVWIVAAREAGAVEIAVADTGIGIAEADLHRMGRPFEQAGTVPSAEGTGLGLALVKALAALHGGEVRIQSAPGAGTVVRVRLPHAAVSDVTKLSTSRRPPEAQAALKGAA